MSQIHFVMVLAFGFLLGAAACVIPLSVEWQTLGALAAAGAAAVAAAVAWKNTEHSKKSTSAALFIQIVQDYASDDMGRAMQSLYSGRESNNRVTRTMPKSTSAGGRRRTQA